VQSQWFAASFGLVHVGLPVGFDDAQPGGHFIKIGIGAPRKQDGAYGNYHLYEIADGGKIIYTKTLTGEDVVAAPIEGFGSGVNDHQIRTENSRLGAGMKIETDRPLSKESLWSIRTVLAMEPFVAIDIDLGHEFSWTTQYEYYLLPEHK